MVQELTSKRVAIIGAGPAGCICAKFLQDSGINVSLFDKSDFLRTILPTGGGKCNLTHNEYDFKSLVKNYPRGEKFLYSIFAKFGIQDTLDFFKSIGIETYTREDNRIFPKSNSAKEVQNKLLKSLNKTKFIKESVIEIVKTNNYFELKTTKSKYYFDNAVVSIGGHSGYEIISNLGINIIEPKPALTGLKTSENFSDLSGVSLKNVIAKVDNERFKGDFLFTHKGISGPVVYEISSVFARKNYPYKITFEFCDIENFQQVLNSNPHKEIKNIISEYIPKAFAVFILKKLGINENIKCHMINGNARDLILKNLKSYDIEVTNCIPDGEIVTCGGVDLKGINPQTLEAKSVTGLYFCGEVLDIDGFCGGYNLQNCWSTGYVTAQSIINS